MRCSAVYSLADSVAEVPVKQVDSFDKLFGALVSTRWLSTPHALLERLPQNEQCRVQVVAHVFSPSLNSLHAALRVFADSSTAPTLSSASGRSRSPSFNALLAMAHQLEWTRALLAALKFAEPSALLTLLQRNRRRLESTHNSFEELLTRFIEGVRSTPADGARSCSLSDVGNEDLSLLFWRFASSSCTSLEQLRCSFHELFNLFKSPPGSGSSGGLFQPYVQSSNSTALALLLRREQLRATQSLLERVDLPNVLPSTLPAALKRLYVDEQLLTLLPLLLAQYSSMHHADADELSDAAQLAATLQAASGTPPPAGARLGADPFYPRMLALLLFLSAQLALEMLGAELRPLLRMPPLILSALMDY